MCVYVYLNIKIKSGLWTFFTLIVYWWFTVATLPSEFYAYHIVMCNYVCHLLAGWASTSGLVWHCGIPCLACPPCCFSVCFYGAHEASAGKGMSLAFDQLTVCYVLSWSFPLKIVFFWQTDDPTQKNTLLVFKFLPLMIGYFSLSVPSGLSIYWWVSDIIFHLVWHSTSF